MNPTAVVAYLALFGTVGFVFIFCGLLLGRFLRAQKPTPEKQEIYECGEPPIGSGYLQFDLRFYVVALVFIIFEVELAFFFPWAVVFGKANQLTDPNLAIAAPAGPGVPAVAESGPQLSPAAIARLDELGIRDTGLTSGISVDQAAGDIRRGARKLALTAMADMAVFFAVLLVGFAYVWHRGDLDWVRTIGQPTSSARLVPGQRGDG